MLPPITKKYDDHSTDAHFVFSFYCDECGAVWTSEEYPYSLAGMEVHSEAEKNAHMVMWKTEHDAAYERANVEALFRFGKCPSCGRRVCDRCFSDWDTVCRRCASKTWKEVFDL